MIWFCWESVKFDFCEISSKIEEFGTVMFSFSKFVKMVVMSELIVVEEVVVIVITVVLVVVEVVVLAVVVKIFVVGKLLLAEVVAWAVVVIAAVKDFVVGKAGRYWFSAQFSTRGSHSQSNLSNILYL